MSNKHKKNETGYIFVRSITKNGKKMYPKNGKAFKIPIDSFKTR